MENKDHTTFSQEIGQLKERLVKQNREIEDLKISNLFLATLFDGISEEILVLDRNFNVTDVNRAFLERYGLKKSEALGKKCYKIKKRASAPCNFEDESCPLALARKTGERVEITLTQEDAKGGRKELALYMYPLKLRGKSIKYFMEIARDVTENRALMRKLQASEKRFRAILDTATDAVLSIDENQKIILFNNAAQRIFGYSREEVLGKNLNMLVPSRYGDHERFVRHFLEKRESDIVGKTISLTALRKGGEEFPVELSLSFLEMDSEITFTAIVRDVSDQRKLEKKLLQSERLAAVGQAVAHVTHELKNPLMIIGGFSAQLRKRLEDDRDLQKMSLMLEEVKRLEKMVANLGDFTREYRLLKRSADVNSVIKEVLKIMAGVHTPGKYLFKESLSGEVGEIRCDPDKLRQVLMNVISNGLEAMADGGSIAVVTDRVAGGIEIRISDEGIGISEDDLQHIFEPFYTTRARGSGLGLSISYKIIEAHGGDISAVSRPGKGTTFVIRLPAE